MNGIRDRMNLERLDGPPTFTPFPKIARLNREIVITEKIDGTNAAVQVLEDGRVYAQSRTRIISPESDNFGFARWVEIHRDELREGLGVGTHFGEWWGGGIQRGYGLSAVSQEATVTDPATGVTTKAKATVTIKRFSLFNVGRWTQLHVGGANPPNENPSPHLTPAPECCNVVPVLYRGEFSEAAIKHALERLRAFGSLAAPGFMKPEGIVVFHTGASTMFKVTLEGDEKPKGAR